jgi:hypothetical protein
LRAYLGVALELDLVRHGQQLVVFAALGVLLLHLDLLDLLHDPRLGLGRPDHDVPLLAQQRLTLVRDDGLARLGHRDARTAAGARGFLLAIVCIVVCDLALADEGHPLGALGLTELLAHIHLLLLGTE